ncbi:hypothetical protein AURDEDRAFT_133872 [Auricularia subglabra TFB-10046 SS5]|nr:hypothetical protein AURDEDRAFT_133872 [Auricularia subglabra TFB-10046 SS5]
MAPQTADDVISRGEYLAQGFDPTRLTIPLLQGVLNYHGVPVRAGNKAALVRAFEEHIAPRVVQLGRERLARQGSQASDEGIMDGVTGRQVNRPAQRKSNAAPANTSKRGRASQYRDEVVPLKDDDDDDEIVEDSEPEGSMPRASVKQGRPKSKGRRLSDITGRELEEDRSGAWSTDYNPFQSGGESSSPARPPPVEKKRLSAVPAKRAGRRSVQPRSSSPAQEEAPPPPRRQSARPQRVAAPVVRSPPKPRSPSPEEEEEEEEEEAAQEENAYEELEAADEVDLSYNNALEQEGHYTQVARRLAGQAVVPHRQQQFKMFSTPTAVLLLLLLAFLGGLLESYKLQSSAIGFCDAGTSTNGVLQARAAARDAAIECSRRTADQIQSGVTEVDDCKPLPLVPAPRPTRCTPCPAHGHCAGHTVTCESGFQLQRHALDHVPLLSSALDGLPGFGPVALPPYCAVDQTRRNIIGKLAKSIENQLAQLRGERLCEGAPIDIEYGGEAVQWGIPLEELRSNFAARAPTNKSTAQVADLFNQAISELLKHDLIVSGDDSAGVKYVSAKESRLGLACAVRVRARQTWREWRGAVFATLFSLAGLVYGRRHLAIRAREKKRVAGLVQTALDALRTQEFEHHADPASTRQPYLSPLQLRDWVLQDEHSVSARKRLWHDVEKIVESNANVRANVEEVEGGEETRVWRWVGSSNAPRRVKMEPSKQRIVA